jgi:FAD/FMN-containing dehydrogenase/Fe-S oxidoreductase
LAGEALGTGLVVDLSRHFRSILDIGPDTVRVQPGVVYQQLNDQLARVGRRFAPDPASGLQCTIGGMLATNASGARALRYGYTRDHVVRLRVVLDSGEAAWVGREPAQPSASLPPGHLQDILLAVAALLEEHAELIRTCQPRTRFNCCGYLLADVLTAGSVDLPRLLVGSEGTLALFMEATLRTVPLPADRSLVLLAFDRLDAAVRAAAKAVPANPVACELLDRRVLTLARGSDPDLAALVPAAAESVLLVEFEADAPGEARRAARQLLDRFYRADRLAHYAVAAYEPEEVDRLWRVRDLALPSLYGLRGGAQAVAFVEDVGVPLPELPAYLHGVHEILQRHETTASFLVHAGTGQVHTRPFLDLQHQPDVSKLWALAEEIHGLALGLGGTVSTQHGTGLARTPWVARQYGPLYEVFRQLKAIFDPHHLFNPGKIIGPDPGMPTWPLRKGMRDPGLGVRSGDTGPGPEARAPGAEPGNPNPEPAAPSPPPLALRWQPHEIRTEIFSCNGCGHCRTETPAHRMCPLFRATQAEEATPRAKANLMRHLLHESTDPRLLSSDQVRAVADLCVNCKMCALECPAHVNIPKLMLEAKAANVAEYGLSRSDWVFARTESFAAFGSALAFVANAALASRGVRWFLEKFAGISQQRRLPLFAGRSFLRRARQRGWTRPPRGNRPRVAYFVDLFANYNEPQIAEATVAVLHHNGIEVYVPPGQRGCGMAAYACGDVEAARETAAHNLRLFADLAREGYPIVCSEPTAAFMLRQDYLDLLQDPDARLVSGQVVELTALLGDLHREGRLRTDFRPVPISVGHHVPCHLKALGRPPAGPALLALIPELRVHTIDVSCSGMAGTFGLKAENYAVSLEAGRPMLQEMRRPRVLFGSSECSTCRLQMEDGTGKRTLHPVQYLALAYGLMPGVLKRLQQPLREFVLQ